MTKQHKYTRNLQNTTNSHPINHYITASFWGNFPAGWQHGHSASVGGRQRCGPNVSRCELSYDTRPRGHLTVNSPGTRNDFETRLEMTIALHETSDERRVRLCV